MRNHGRIEPRGVFGAGFRRRAVSFADALRVVKRRGEAMQAAADATPSGMLSVLLLDRDKVDSIRQRASEAGVLQFANFLCPGNLVLSGEKAACAKG